jgi:hypothetical protein
MPYEPEPESGIVTGSAPPSADPQERVESWHEREHGGAPFWLLAVAVIAVVVVPAIAFYMSAA